ncbi:hypothetical protein KM1_015620, partial [Entamoeba histolytica HM-3:IMSS]
LTVLA